jgi:glycogen debranching enzyme
MPSLGDIRPAGARELGLFDRDVRHLSHYALTLVGAPTVRLSSEAVDDGYDQIDLMATDLEEQVLLDDPKNFLHVRRRQLLDEGLVEQIALTSFLRRPITLEVRLDFGADFVDVFEVRGARRARRGTTRPPSVAGKIVTLGYDGLDRTRYETSIAFSETPEELGPAHARFRLRVAPGATARLEIDVAPRRAEAPTPPRRHGFDARAEQVQRDVDAFRVGATRFRSDNARLDRALDRATGDLHALRVRVGEHAVLGAGIPWFCAPFGRDALLASFEALTLAPELAVEALRTLAAFQGTRVDDEREEEPGKILHELRFGEMARTGEIPHSPYYGSVDATPLFVILVDACHRFLGDRARLRELRDPVLAALAWIDAASEQGTRLVSYVRKAPRGLENQGWKDSRAGVCFPDGRRAIAPIALCEVQGYCVDAYARGAAIFSALGEHEHARVYEARAARLRELVEAELWLEEQGRYAFAVDGEGRRVDTIVSNLGHLLWSRVPSRERAVATAKLLLSPASWSGYGVRTLACGQPAYNPLGYHTGTVWPHDNAILAAGMGAYDLHAEGMKLFEGLYTALGAFTDRRLPELFCGLPRGAGPLVRYPVACTPQAWSIAAPFLLLQTLLGIRPDAPRGRLVIRNPRLPRNVRWLEIESMRVGAARVSMRFRRFGARCHVDRLDVKGGSLKTEIEID